jgi:hypothetical protein
MNPTTTTERYTPFVASNTAPLPFARPSITATPTPSAPLPDPVFHHLPCPISLSICDWLPVETRIKQPADIEFFFQSEAMHRVMDFCVRLGESVCARQQCLKVSSCLMMIVVVDTSSVCIN